MQVPDGSQDPFISVRDASYSQTGETRAEQEQALSSDQEQMVTGDRSINIGVREKSDSGEQPEQMELIQTALRDAIESQGKIVFDDLSDESKEQLSNITRVVEEAILRYTSIDGKLDTEAAYQQIIQALGRMDEMELENPQLKTFVFMAMHNTLKNKNLTFSQANRVLQFEYNKSYSGEEVAEIIQIYQDGFKAAVFEKLEELGREHLEFVQMRLEGDMSGNGGWSNADVINIVNRSLAESILSGLYSPEEALSEVKSKLSDYLEKPENKDSEPAVNTAIEKLEILLSGDKFANEPLLSGNDLVDMKAKFKNQFKANITTITTGGRLGGFVRRHARGTNTKKVEKLVDELLSDSGSKAKTKSQILEEFDRKVEEQGLSRDLPPVKAARRSLFEAMSTENASKVFDTFFVQYSKLSGKETPTRIDLEGWEDGFIDDVKKELQQLSSSDNLDNRELQSKVLKKLLVKWSSSDDKQKNTRAFIALHGAVTGRLVPRRILGQAVINCKELGPEKGYDLMNRQLAFAQSFQDKFVSSSGGEELLEWLDGKKLDGSANKERVDTLQNLLKMMKEQSSAGVSNEEAVRNISQQLLQNCPNEDLEATFERIIMLGNAYNCEQFSRSLLPLHESVKDALLDVIQQSLESDRSTTMDVGEFMATLKGRVGQNFTLGQLTEEFSSLFPGDENQKKNYFMKIQLVAEISQIESNNALKPHEKFRNIQKVIKQVAAEYQPVNSEYLSTLGEEEAREYQELARLSLSLMIEHHKVDESDLNLEFHTRVMQNVHEQISSGRKQGLNSEQILSKVKEHLVKEILSKGGDPVQNYHAVSYALRAVGQSFKMNYVNSIPLHQGHKDRLGNSLAKAFQRYSVEQDAGEFIQSLELGEFYTLDEFIEAFEKNFPGRPEILEDIKLRINLEVMDVEDIIRSTPPISRDYFNKQSPEEQLENHELAKLKVKIMSERDDVGATFYTAQASGPRPSSTPENPNDVVIDTSKVEESGCTLEVSYGTKEDIEADGNRDEDNIVVYGAASQCNGCEAPREFTCSPWGAYGTYLGDRTQGPQAQLAYQKNQLEIIAWGGNLGLNILAPLMNKETQTMTRHGYCSPENPQQAIAFRDSLVRGGHLIGLSSVANKPNGGSKDVHMTLASALAFGQYRHDVANPIPDDIKEQIQYLMLLENTRAQFQYCINLAKDSGDPRKPVVCKPCAVGLGVFGNDPEIAAKAFYAALMEYSHELKENDVTVKFQIYHSANEYRQEKAGKFVQLLGW